MSKTRIDLKGSYKDQHAVVMEGDTLRATILPEQGAKLASLIYKPANRELLVQALGSEYRPLTYGGNYVDAECSGFDEMFPTIDPIACSTIAHSEVILPDHGEVCRMPWDYRIEGETLVLSVQGRCIPYSLEKRLSLTADGYLRGEYVLHSNCEEDLPFIWAAHCMLQAEKEGQITVPVEPGRECILMFSEPPLAVKKGSKLNWPSRPMADGGTERLDKSLPFSQDGATYKYYFTEPITEGWCRYEYPSDHLAVTLRFPPQNVPWLGVWVNNGGFKGYYNVAFEPATAPYDRPDISAFHGAASVLKSGEAYRWYLEIGASVPCNIRSIREGN